MDALRYRRCIEQKWCEHELPRSEIIGMIGRRYFLRTSDRQAVIDRLRQSSRFRSDGLCRILFHGLSARESWREDVPYDSLHITSYADGTFEADIDDGNPQCGWRPATLHVLQFFRQNRLSAAGIAFTAAFNSRFANLGHPYRAALASLAGGFLCCAGFGLARLRRVRTQPPRESTANRTGRLPADARPDNDGPNRTLTAPVSPGSGEVSPNHNGPKLAA